LGICVSDQNFEFVLFQVTALSFSVRSNQKTEKPLSIYGKKAGVLYRVCRQRKKYTGV